jgi:hypothetical protein
MTNVDDKTTNGGIPQTLASEAETKVEKPTFAVLHVTTPLQKGPKVLDVQQQLFLLGFFSGVCNSVYDGATETAVRAFQRSRGLTCDGIVGPVTRNGLLSASPEDAAPQPSGESPGLLALYEAASRLAIKENPPGSNKTMFGVWYGHDGLKWCSIFVSYCFAVGAGKLICDNFSGPGVKAGKGCAYVPTVCNWLKATGQWLGKVSHPRPGDIVIFNFKGIEPDHIGIVDKDLGNGTYFTIEGNTSLSSDSDGGEVARRTRKLSQIEGFGRIAG